MSISRTADLIYTYRFLRLMTTQWKDQDAFEHGIIDDKGKVLRPSRTLRTPAEKDSFTLFHRLIFNLKRILEALPFGKTRLASYAAALFLLRESTDLTDEQIEYVLDKMGVDFSDALDESTTRHWYTLENDNISPGKYKLKSSMTSHITGESLGNGNIIITEMAPVSNIFGAPIYEAEHLKSGSTVYVSIADLEDKIG